MNDEEVEVYDDLDRLAEYLGIDLDNLVVPCARCGFNVAGDKTPPTPLPCGYCDASLCPNCGLIWASFGPVHPDHYSCGCKGHMTLAEQPHGTKIGLRKPSLHRVGRRKRKR